jgi:hypothetical protein
MGPPSADRTFLYLRRWDPSKLRPINIGSVRGKVGGGWAEERATLSLPNGTSWSGSSVKGGWLAGGGLEYAFKANWTVKLEYDARSPFRIHRR